MSKKTNKLGDLLRRIRTERSASIPALAEKLGVDRNTLGAFERGERLPDVEFLDVFSRTTGWDLSQLLRARLSSISGSPQAQEVMKRLGHASDATMRFVIKRSSLADADVQALLQFAYESDADDDALEKRFGKQFPAYAGIGTVDSEYVSLPLYDLRAAAGGGAVVEGEQVIDVLKFKREWISAELRLNQKDLCLIYVEGDSMEPELRAGDIILIDRRDTGPNRDAIYVMRIDDALLVKRLQRLPGGQLRVTSDNPRYDPFLLKNEELENVVIVGRVVWAGRRM